MTQNTQAGKGEKGEKFLFETTIFTKEISALFISGKSTTKGRHVAFKYNLSYLGAPVQRRNVTPQPRRTEFVQPCAIFSYHAQGRLSHPSCNPFIAPASSVFGSLSSPAMPAILSTSRKCSLFIVPSYITYFFVVSKKERNLLRTPASCPVVHRCYPHGSVRSLHFPPFLKNKSAQAADKQVKMDASKKKA